MIIQAVSSADHQRRLNSSYHCLPHLVPIWLEVEVAETLLDALPGGPGALWQQQAEVMHKVLQRQQGVDESCQAHGFIPVICLPEAFLSARSISFFLLNFGFKYRVNCLSMYTLSSLGFAS